MTDMPFAITTHLTPKHKLLSHTRNQQRSRKSTQSMKSSEPSSAKANANVRITDKPQKPPFRPAKDDTKPVLQDPILRSDPIETEEAVLRLPPFCNTTSTSTSKMA